MRSGFPIILFVASVYRPKMAVEHPCAGTSPLFINSMKQLYFAWIDIYIHIYYYYYYFFFIVFKKVVSSVFSFYRPPSPSDN